MTSATGFRGHEPTASLKLHHQPRGHRLSTSFRGHEPTASLKPELLHHHLADDLTFPWARAHGLIEAHRHGTPAPGGGSFRGHEPTASLKPEFVARHAGHRAGFRGHEPTASLKLDQAREVARNPEVSVGTSPRPH